MTTVIELLNQLRTRDIKIWVENDNLRINAPKDALDEALKSELRQRKLEIIVYLNDVGKKQAINTPSLVPVDRGTLLPLSFAQQRLWFLDQLEAGNVAYNIPGAIRLQGVLNVTALQQSLGEIVKRHESLRTTFAVVDGQPVQQISPVESFKLPLVVLSDYPNSKRETEAGRLVTEEATRPFDLTKDCLFRASLIQLAGEEHILLVTMHHIVADGWSMGVFIEELKTLYQAFLQGKLSSLPDLLIQYSDYAHWQREWLQGETLEAQLTYWRQQLDGSLPILEMSSDHPRPKVQTYKGARQSFILPLAMLNKLEVLSQREECTLFMTLLAAFKVLLYRYTGQEDMIVGSPIANRNRVETERLIGFFVNTLILRTDLSNNPTFRELMGRVREVAMGAYDHQDVPFELLVEELHPERDASRPPLFQVMFILQNAPVELMKLSGLTLSPVKRESNTSKFELTLDVGQKHNGFNIAFEYNTDLFEANTISRMMGHFRNLLEDIAVNPDQPISKLSLMAEAEQQLLAAWNDKGADYPHTKCIQQLIEDQTEQVPEAVVVVFDETSLTYQELNARANQLAHYLQKLGVGPDVFVGVYMERSLQMIVGLLGILKAGGAYVPLDPSFPKDRLAYMLEDSQTQVLLTQYHLLNDAPEHQAQVVCVDHDWEVIAEESQENAVNQVKPNNLAYAIYTSGSTGRPKGVQIEHRGLVNFLVSMGQEPGLKKDDTLLAVTTLSFDIAGLELFLPLMVGAKVVLVSSAVASDGIRLLEVLDHSKATVMQATPATWRLLLATGWHQENPLKILCGGEAMPRDLADQLLERSNSVWNLYGPTETTIWSTVNKVEPGNGPVSIGCPIANTQIYILDAHQQPVPIGVSGELYIGGDGLARGYLNRPELTREKFIPNPFSDKPNARLYRTGDLARYLSGGKLEFFGRIDHQVKVRGFRIELEEIEAVLEKHSTVQQAVVMAREDIPGDKRLVAYLITNDQSAPSVSELRNFLKETLPDYMIPSAFTFMTEFPLTPNKKVNRRALPPPDSIRPDLEAAYVAPKTKVERTTASIWQKVLKLEKIGVHDNFFDLGGHSLLLVQVQNELQKAFNKDIPIADMFRYPTIDAVSKYLGQEQREQRSFQKIHERVQRRSRAVSQRKRSRKEREELQ